MARGKTTLDDDTEALLRTGDTLHAGWLQKKALTNGRWQKRWVVVKKGYLLYFTNSDAACNVDKRKGSLFIINSPIRFCC
jgi:hypothetical protein